MSDAIKKWSRHLMIDFDGVLYIAQLGFNRGVLMEGPMEGAREALTHLVNYGFQYTVFTSRMALTDTPDATRDSIMGWLKFHGFPAPLDVTCEKRPALVYLDNRGRRFAGWQDFRDTYA